MTHLPTCLFRGHTVRVKSLDSIEVELQLGFGVSIRKAVRLEGIEAADIPGRLASDAKHCLVVLLGGKKVLVHTDEHRRGRFLVGRVYLDERTYGDPVGMATPFGLDVTRLDVSTFYDWLRKRSYDIKLVKAVLNGHSNPQNESKKPLALRLRSPKQPRRVEE